MKCPLMRTIHFNGQRFVAAPDETILDALLRQGAPMAYSCRKGSCHTCVLECIEGEVRHQRTIDPAIMRDGHLLPCVAVALTDVLLGPANPLQLSIAGEIVERTQLADDLFEIGIAPSTTLIFQAGQHVQLVRADGLSRPYSLACVQNEDWFVRFHVRCNVVGPMSQWLCHEATIGERVGLLAPQGRCHYRPELRERSLLLLATGSGLGALAALARQALAEGHCGPIVLYHGVRHVTDLYLQTLLEALAVRHENFTYRACVSAANHVTRAGIASGRITDVAFEAIAEPEQVELFLCGAPAMVEDARYRAVLSGIPRSQVHADPFQSSAPSPPRDRQRIERIAADPDLWDALERGPRLRRILEAFYARVYLDPDLSPFFAKVARTHAVAKQYAFLADLFSGARDFFGLNPFNAHHWMVISDALFDHREALFEQVLREDGLAAPLIRRWLALHERFRADMVKPVARGMVIQGLEQPLHTHVVEYMDIASVCDACGNEIPAGAPSRYQYRAGTLHCADCAGIATESA